jgi:hypothetical protein
LQIRKLINQEILKFKTEDTFLEAFHQGFEKKNRWNFHYCVPNEKMKDFSKPRF